MPPKPTCVFPVVKLFWAVPDPWHRDSDIGTVTIQFLRMNVTEPDPLGVSAGSQNRATGVLLVTSVQKIKT